jgi:plasmid stabilization system protein ParE
MAEREVRWTRTAQHDLNAIVGYIADDCTDNALAVLDRLQRRAETLSDGSSSLNMWKSLILLKERWIRGTDVGM